MKRPVRFRLPITLPAKLLTKYRRWWPIGIVALGIIVAGIIVLTPRPTATPIVTSIAALKNCPTKTEFDCYANYFINKTEDTDPKTALAAMRQAYDQGDQYVISQCHQLAHQVGHAGFKKYNSLAKAYVKGDNFCWSGYYHGVTEQAVGAIGADRIKKEANNICAELAKSKPYSFDHFNCVHGLGHGFMAVNNYELFDSLKSCDLLRGSWERSSCYGGVFMENIMVVVRQDGNSKYLKPDQPLYPCTAVGPAYKQQCYLMQTSYALQKNGYDFAKAFLLCRDVADPEYTMTCYQSMGRDASGSTVSNVAKTKAKCELAPDVIGVENCMLGAVRDFVSYYHSDTQAKELCAAFSPDLQQRCSAEMTSYYSTFN